MEMLYKDKLDIDDNITFGLEIEFEDVYMYQIKKALRDKSYFWKVYYDYSLKDNGGEVVTPVLKNTKKAYIDIKNVCEILKSIDVNPDKNAAFQIHYGADIFKRDYKNLLRFYKMWCIYENIIYKYSYGKQGVPREPIYRYADMCGRKIYTLLKYSEHIPLAKYKDGKFVESFDNYTILLGNNRSYGLSFRYDNYKEFSDVKTIEIRTMNGTIDEVLIQNYIKFFYELLSYPTKEEYDEEFINYKYEHIDINRNTIYNSLKEDLEKAKELCDLILKDEYDKMCFLAQYTNDKELIRKL